jgi:phosphoribosylformylglycinamidine synthase
MSQAWSEIVILPSEGQAGPGLRLTVPALANEAAALSALGAFVDPVTETGAVFSSWGTVAREETLTARTVLSVGPLPGVTDPIAKTALEVLADLGLIPADAQGYAERLRVVESATGAPATLARLFNPLIERGSVTTTTALWRFVGEEPPKVRLTGEEVGLVLEVDLPDRDEDLLAFSRHGIPGPDGTGRGPLGLQLSDLHAIREHYAALGRKPTDIEIETLAQTWSEHCKHRLFNADLEGADGGLFKTFIAGATKKVRAARGKDDICLSVFSDNAGGIVFDDDYLVCDKVETHNSPSALDPYGGAMTGVVGVNRDCLGFGQGAQPILNRYGFCLPRYDDASVLYRDKDGDSALPSARRLIDGVIKGIEDGGNQSGIPTPQGFIMFDERYRGKPLVFAGTVGLMPRMLPDGRDATIKGTQPGDAIVMVGGRVGKDGIHGATFSSVALDESSPATAVQIGDPITQKRLSDALIFELRDQGLIRALTDNGAGGLSSSIGEMAEETGGAEIWLDRVPLKYPGLSPWEIWISEAQERMSLAVKPENVQAVIDHFATRGVEATEIGCFTDTGTLVATYEDKQAMALDMEFLHEAPRLSLPVAAPAAVQTRSNAPALPSVGECLTTLMAQPNMRGRTPLIRRYDHEVQANSVLKPLQGLGALHADATAVRPVLDRPGAVAVTQSLFPRMTERDPYAAAVNAVDLSLRQLVAMGATLDRAALLDNFCWCSADQPERLYQLREAARGCHDTAVQHLVPFVSGKDSMFNDFKGFDADGAPLAVSALPTLLISALAVLPDWTRAVSMDFKAAGDAIFWVGSAPEDALGRSELALGLGLNDDDLATPIARVEADYSSFEAATAKGLVASAVAAGWGGAAAALTRSALAGGLSADVNVGWTAAQWFTESAGGMLVTTSQTDADAFASTVAQAQRIGTVTDTETMMLDGEAVSTAAVLNAYRTDESGEISR